jgi:hypothetical protein
MGLDITRFFQGRGLRIQICSLEADLRQDFRPKIYYLLHIYSEFDALRLELVGKKIGRFIAG